MRQKVDVVFDWKVVGAKVDVEHVFVVVFVSVKNVLVGSGPRPRFINYDQFKIVTLI
jgi:hypothetical protein